MPSTPLTEMKGSLPKLFGHVGSAFTHCNETSPYLRTTVSQNGHGPAVWVFTFQPFSPLPLLLSSLLCRSLLTSTTILLNRIRSRSKIPISKYDLEERSTTSSCPALMMCPPLVTLSWRCQRVEAPILISVVFTFTYAPRLLIWEFVSSPSSCLISFPSFPTELLLRKFILSCFPSAFCRGSLSADSHLLPLKPDTSSRCCCSSICLSKLYALCPAL